MLHHQFKDNQDHLVHLALMAHLALRVIVDRLVHQEHQVEDSPDHQDQLDHLDFVDLLVCQALDSPAHLVHQEVEELMEVLDHQDLLVPKEKLEKEAFQDHLGHQVLLEVLAHRVAGVFLALQEIQEQVVDLGQVDCLEVQDSRDQEVSQEEQGPQVSLEELEILEQLVYQDLQDPRVLLVHVVHLVVRELLETKGLEVLQDQEVL